ncbi:MAG: hypothetical protein O3C40_21485 [Planctomycetota bacterium]|nr:hypothetical protein [Planctomycetota bacterium]
MRGGSWNNNASQARAGNRNYNTPDNRNNNIGFRVLRVCAASTASVAVRNRWQLPESCGLRIGRACRSAVPITVLRRVASRRLGQITNRPTRSGRHRRRPSWGSFRSTVRPVRRESHLGKTLWKSDLAKAATKRGGGGSWSSEIADPALRGA